MKIDSKKDINNNDNNKDIEMDGSNGSIDSEELKENRENQENEEELNDSSQQDNSEDRNDQDSMIDENYMKREAEFFKFHPFSFIDDVHESAHDYCADSADFIESCLLGHPLFSDKQEYKDSIQDGTDKVWNLLEEIFTNNLNKYEEYLIANVFNIPNDLVLPHETVSTTSTATTSKSTTAAGGHLYNKSINILDKELEDLRTNIQKLSNENSSNKIKIQDLESDIGLLKSIESNLSTDFNNIENINMINQQRKILDYNYQVLKSNNNNNDKLNNNNNNNNNNNSNNNHNNSNNNNNNNNNGNNNERSISVQKSILDKMNSLNLNESNQLNIQKEIKSIETSSQLLEKSL